MEKKPEKHTISLLNPSDYQLLKGRCREWFYLRKAPKAKSQAGSHQLLMLINQREVILWDPIMKQLSLGQRQNRLQYKVF